MPLPSDEKLMELSEDLIRQFDQIFGLHPGFRPAHAKGVLLEGVFRPTPAARELARAPHFVAESTPVTVRFSNSTGLPMIPDNDANAEPRGMATRFQLGEHVHTDLIAHSVDAFPTRTGAEFLEFLRALAAGPGPGSALEQFLGSHPAALRFVQMPKPAPVSYATEPYFGVNAMRFTNAAGVVRYGRYRITPALGEARVSAEALPQRQADYLLDEIKHAVAAGPVTFHVMVQLADEGDVTDDATVHWPEERTLEHVGSIELNGVVADDAAAQKQIIFDPIPRVDGIEPSDDPLLELRAAVYLISGRRRRAA